MARIAEGWKIRRPAGRTVYKVRFTVRDKRYDLSTGKRDRVEAAHEAERLYALAVEGRLDGQLPPPGTASLRPLAGPLSEWLASLVTTHDESTLVTYAQRGLPVWDWDTHGEARDGVQSVVSTLYACPADTSIVGPLAETDLDDADLDDPLALVLVAAWARVQLADGEALTVRQLGALAGLDASVIRKMNKDGEITLTGIRPCVADAAESRRWLGARGVKGL